MSPKPRSVQALFHEPGDQGKGTTEQRLGRILEDQPHPERAGVSLNSWIHRQNLRTPRHLWQRVCKVASGVSGHRNETNVQVLSDSKAPQVPTGLSSCRSLATGGFRTRLLQETSNYLNHSAFLAVPHRWPFDPITNHLSLSPCFLLVSAFICVFFPSSGELSPPTLWKR